MPNYIYKHPKKEEYVEVVQGMNDEHVYFDEDGIEWERRWTVPQAIVSSYSNLNAFDTREAARMTGDKKGSVGDLWDLSKELSERRVEKLGGEDPIKRKYLKQYEKERGVKHFSDMPTKFENDKVSIDFDKPGKSDKDLGLD